MLDLKTRADLQRLIDEGLPESLTLDYKASPALNKNNDGRAELVKDVTAFANSAGGQIVYGVHERAGVPQALDLGGDSDAIAPEWIEQIIDTNTSPRIQGLKITKIVLTPERPNMVAYVIIVPPATTFAPHQNSIDKKYYRRFELRSVPMHDYEIRDLLRRAQVPNIAVRMAFRDGSSSYRLRRRDEHVEIKIDVENISSEPVLYSIIEILIDHRLPVVDKIGSKTVMTKIVGEYTLHSLQRTMMVPNDFPMMKGSTIPFGPPLMTIMIPREYFDTNTNFLVGYAALTSGFHSTRCAALILREKVLTITEFFDV